MWEADNIQDDVRPLVVQIANSFSSSFTASSHVNDSNYSQASAGMANVGHSDWAGRPFISFTQQV
jgi:hypothetical protein